MQMLFEFYQFLALAFLQSRDRNVRPAGNHFRDVFLGHLFAKERFLGLRTLRRSLGQFPFQLGNPAILQFARFSQFTAACGALKLGPQPIEFFFPFSLLVDNGFFLLPLGFERTRFLL